MPPDLPVNRRQFLGRAAKAGAVLLAAGGIASLARDPAGPGPATAPAGAAGLSDFSLPQAGEVSLRVHDVGGRLVRTILTGELPAGRHEVGWEGVDERGRAVASGAYFVRLDGAGREASRKLLLRR